MIKEKLLEILKDKELTLKEIYIILPNIKQEAIRSRLNFEVKHNRTFERTGKGRYKIKEIIY